VDPSSKLSYSNWNGADPTGGDDAAFLSGNVAGRWKSSDKDIAIGDNSRRRSICYLNRYRLTTSGKSTFIIVSFLINNESLYFQSAMKLKRPTLRIRVTWTILLPMCILILSKTGTQWNWQALHIQGHTITAVTWETSMGIQVLLYPDWNQTKHTNMTYTNTLHITQVYNGVHFTAQSS